MKPLLKWVGGKSAILPVIRKHFPEKVKTYYEPFVGGGAVLFDTDFRRVHVNDANAELVNFYRTVASFPRMLMWEVDKLAAQYSEAFFYQLRSETPVDSIAKAARFLFLNRTCFNGLYRVNRAGNFNVPFCKRSECPNLYDVESVLDVHDRLACATISCEDFEKIIDLAGDGDFVYCDPPYIPVSKTAKFTSYTAGGFTGDDHHRLAKACTGAWNRGAKVLISNSDSPLLHKLYPEAELQRIVAPRRINRGPDAIEYLVKMF